MGAFDAISEFLGNVKKSITAPEVPPGQEWKETDPRYQYVPGRMARSHVSPVPAFATTQDAQDWAKQQFNGMPVYFDSPDDPRPPAQSTEEMRIRDFRRIAPTLERAWESGIRFPAALHIEREQDGEDPSFRRNTATMAYYMPRDGSIHMNRSFFGRYDDPNNTLLHELGHRVDDRRRWSWGEKDPQRATAEKVSEYAASHPDEFVAEVYARRAGGKDVGADAEQLYEQAHGPSVPRLLPSPPDLDSPAQEEMFIRQRGYDATADDYHRHIERNKFRVITELLRKNK